MNQIQQAELKKELTPILLWGLGVGYVISGMYFGWNLGLKEGGTMGMAIATFFSIMLYSFFSLSYAELACYIPKAGGVFDYTYKAWGKDLGLDVYKRQPVRGSYFGTPLATNTPSPK